MRYFNIFVITIFFFVCPLFYTQSIGLSFGYGKLNMDKVNSDLDDSYRLFSSAGLYSSEPEKLSGGLFLEGNIKYNIANFNLGLEGDYISTTGNFNYNDYSGSFTENYDVSTTEILGLIEILVQVNGSIIQPFLQAAGGIGIASAEHKGELRLYSDPSNNMSVKNSVTGNYFAGRIKGGLQFVIQNIILETAIGYRLSNGGELKGNHTENGIIYENMPVRDINGNGLEFDFSGIMFTGGLSIKL